VPTAIAVLAVADIAAYVSLSHSHAVMRHGKSGITARLDPARTDRVTPRSPSVPDVTHDEPRLLACPANERLRHAHPDAEMSIMAAPFETGGTPTAITDGGGMAGMQRVSNRQCSAT
jgi:hypothetical protein